MEVSYLDHLGSDLTIVNAARVSFDKRSDWEWVEDGSVYGAHVKLSVRDTKLINYLFDHKHLLPFRHPHISLHIKAPLFIMRQIDKHQTGFSSSEISRRYVDSEPEFYTPDVWRGKPVDKKQGSSETLRDEAGDPLSVFGHGGSVNDAEGLYKASLRLYEAMLDAGVAPEMARMVLPQAMYTEVHKTGSLLGWWHLYNMRSAPDAQKEVQIIADKVGKIMADIFPVSWSVMTKEKESA